MIQASVWQKKHSLSSSEYIVSQDNDFLYRCVVRYLSGGLKLSLTDADDREVLSMKFPLKGKSGRKHTLSADGVAVGQFCFVRERGQSPYFILETGPYAYTADVVGFGAEGLRAMVFDEVQQVALIEHPLCINERVNEYNITAGEDGALPLLALFSVYYDRTYLNKPKYNNRRFSPVYCFSSKRLRNIYVPDWQNAYVPGLRPQDAQENPLPAEEETPSREETNDVSEPVEEQIPETVPVEPIESLSEASAEPAAEESEPVAEPEDKPAVEDEPVDENEPADDGDEPLIRPDIFENQLIEGRKKRSELDKTLFIEDISEQ